MKIFRTIPCSSFVSLRDLLSILMVYKTGSLDCRMQKLIGKISESCTFFSFQNCPLCTNQLGTFSSENRPDLYIKLFTITRIPKLVFYLKFCRKPVLRSSSVFLFFVNSNSSTATIFFIYRLQFFTGYPYFSEIHILLVFSHR